MKDGGNLWLEYTAVAGPGDCRDGFWRTRDHNYGVAILRPKASEGEARGSGVFDYGGLGMVNPPRSDSKANGSVNCLC